MRATLDLGFVTAWFSRYWLAVWFLTLSGMRLIPIALASPPPVLFFDARLYLAATRAWLAGGNPWEVQMQGLYFAAPPPTLLPLAPLAVLPDDAAVAVLVALVVAAAVATVVALRLPWWWLAFPPLVECLLTANVQALLLPLLLGGAGWLAVVLKVYAAVPLLILGRWRQLAAAGLVTVATYPLLPWDTFIRDFGTISARLVQQADYSLDRTALLVLAPLAVVALIGVGRERAAWLTVPALFSAQWYYTTLAMPTRDAIAMAVIALPVRGSGLLAVVVVALLAWMPSLRRRPQVPVATEAES